MVYARFIKLFLDYLLAAVLATLLSPLAILIAVSYLVRSDYPILFKQQRTGKHGVPFQLLKFRTLTNNEERPLLQRQFFFGRILRTTSIDEIPQLINILLGQMSFIGPRPLPVPYYNMMTPEEKIRYSVKPGITGWAQVNGRHSISWGQKFQLDLYYCKNISFWLDMVIFVKTVKLLFSFSRDKSLQEAPFERKQPKI